MLTCPLYKRNHLLSLTANALQNHNACLFVQYIWQTGGNSSSSKRESLSAHVTNTKHKSQELTLDQRESKIS